MALKPAQSKRGAAFRSDLGEDKLALTRFDGREGLSESFEFQVEAISDDSRIDFDRILGTACGVRINTQDGKIRHFHGYLTETESIGFEGYFYSYRLILRPWFWLLTKSGDCRIFKNKTVIDIVTEVLNAHPFSSFENRTTGSFPNLEYCVQYNESDFDFVSRLLEEYGIYYFFEHSENDHKLILADSKSASKPKVAGPELHYYPLEQKHFQEKETLNELTAVRRFATGKFSLNDFNYMTPHASLLSERQGTAKYKNGKLELYTYPGRFEDKPGGNAAVKVRLEAEQAFDHRFDGAGDSVSCCPGALMKLMKHPQVSDGKEFLILRASHFYRSNAYVSTAAETIEQYSGRYEFLPSDMPYRPPQKTPKPRIFGPQTAFVDGEGEIDVDEHGRILVVFHWSGDRKKTLSRRVRISHGWSGTNWGDIKIPRVGMEVVVEFLNGDPDHPLVTGTVYNKDAEPPYKLPDQNTISGVKSKTVGGNGYNEFIFDDKKDDELIRLHAQRDLDSTIEHDERRKVGNDVKVEIGNNRTETIGQQWKVEAGTKIEFICGQSKIVMTPGSITLQSINIQVTAQAMLSEKAPLTQIQGSANLILQGGLVLIN